MINLNSTPFMKENDKRNPYGPNYYSLPLDTKIYNKFNLVRRFVHINEDDHYLILKWNAGYCLGIFGSFIGGFLIAWGFKGILKKLSINKVLDVFNDFPRIYFGGFCFASTFFAYDILSKKYIIELCEPMMNKYLAEAVKNGFEDYEIS